MYNNKRNRHLTTEEYCTIPAGTQFVIMMRHILFMYAEESISDEDVQSALRQVHDMIMGDDF